MNIDKIITDIEGLDLMSQILLTDIIINLQPCGEEIMSVAKESLRNLEDKRIDIIKDIIEILRRSEKIGGLDGKEVSMLKQYVDNRLYFEVL